jgi:hypothetical protein
MTEPVWWLVHHNAFRYVMLFLTQRGTRYTLNISEIILSPHSKPSTWLILLVIGTKFWTHPCKASTIHVMRSYLPYSCIDPVGPLRPHFCKSVIEPNSLYVVELIDRPQISPWLSTMLTLSCNPMPLIWVSSYNHQLSIVVSHSSTSLTMIQSPHLWLLTAQIQDDRTVIIGHRL